VVQPARNRLRLYGMARPNHAKRSRPRPLSSRSRRLVQLRTAERQSKRKIERWRRGW